ncbi:hypothetical protein C2S52_017693 [Perilla frutescens var. hirtella]|nr:hypothetical protein C2S52_017693 [Perilla frutescens var. hirtella]
MPVLCQLRGLKDIAIISSMRQQKIYVILFLKEHNTELNEIWIHDGLQLQQPLI